MLLPLLLGGCLGWEIPFSFDHSRDDDPDSAWVQITTPHFDVAASTGETSARDLALELELFRALVFELLEAPESELPIPVRVHAFDKGSQIEGANGPGPLAEFPPSMREFQFGLAGRFRGLENLGFALHQYTHLLLYNDFELDYPLWLQEGLAVFLSTAKSSRDGFEFKGNPDEIRLASINLDAFSLERILRIERYGELSEPELVYFTIVSASLVRYLLTVNEQGGFSHQDFARYRDLIGRGQSESAAFEVCFGESPEQAGEKIAELIESKSWPIKRVPLARLGTDPTSYDAKVLSRAEAHTRLASFSLFRYDIESARKHANAALALDPDDARAHAYLGAVLQLENQWEAAGLLYQRALEIDPGNVLNQLDEAEFLHARAQMQIDERARARAFERALSAYDKALALDPSNPETLAKLGEAYLEAEKSPVEANLLVEKAFSIHPASWKILQRLARTQLAIGREDEARELVRRSSERLHKRWTVERLEEIVRSLAAR